MSAEPACNSSCRANVWLTSLHGDVWVIGRRDARSEARAVNFIVMTERMALFWAVIIYNYQHVLLMLNDVRRVSSALGDQTFLTRAHHSYSLLHNWLISGCTTEFRDETESLICVSWKLYKANHFTFLAPPPCMGHAPRRPRISHPSLRSVDVNCLTALAATRVAVL